MTTDFFFEEEVRLISYFIFVFSYFIVVFSCHHA